MAKTELDKLLDIVQGYQRQAGAAAPAARTSPVNNWSGGLSGSSGTTSLP